MSYIILWLNFIAERTGVVVPFLSRSSSKIVGMMAGLLIVWRIEIVLAHDASVV